MAIGGLETKMRRRRIGLSWVRVVDCDIVYPRITGDTTVETEG